MLALPAHKEEKTVALPKYIVTGEKIIGNSITEIPNLIDPIFPKVGVIAIAGSSDTGKSSLLRQLAMEIVSGKEEFLGFPIKATHRSILYVSTEDDYHALSSLMKKQNIGNLNPDSYRNLRFIFDTIDLKKKIKSELNRKPVDAIIIDAFSDLYGGDMNRTNEVRNFIQGFVNMAIENECLIIFLHHTSKRTEDKPPSKNNMIGSQGFEAKMRLVIELRKDYQNPNSQKRHFCLVKGNYLHESYKSHSYVLNFTQNLLFEPTGQRVHFDNLAPPDGRRGNSQARERANEIYSEGLNIDQVHERMTSEGFNIGRSTVGSYVRQNN